MLRFYTGSSEVFVLVLLDAVATNQPHCGASNGDHYVQLPTDDFVKRFGVCQQIMQRRMSLRGDLPHSVVDPFLEFGLVDRGITAPARCKLAVCRHLATARKSGSCTGFSKLWVPYSSEATETCVGYKYPAATCLRSHFQVQAPSHKTAAPATCMSKASSTSFHS